MTQKSSLFKGQQKKKSVPPSHHGKIPRIRKGKRFLKPSKVTADMETDRELSKFINQCNETKAASKANKANKEGGQLNIIKTPATSATGEKK